MKTRRGAAFIAALTVTALALGLAGCGSSADVKNADRISDYFNGEALFPAAPRYETAELSEYDGWEIEKSTDKYILFTDDSEENGVITMRLSVYFYGEKPVLNLPDGYYDTASSAGEYYRADNIFEYSYFSGGGPGLQEKGLAIVIEKNTVSEEGGQPVTVREYTLVDANYNIVAALTEEELKLSSYPVPAVLGTYVMFGNEVYRADESGSLSVFSEYNPLIGIDTEAGELNGNLVRIDNSAGAVYTYNSDFSIKGIYEVPDEAESAAFFILGNGTVLVQYISVMPGDTNDYDFIVDGDKVKLHQYSLDLSKMKTKEFDTDFYIETVINRAVFQAAGQQLSGIEDLFTEKTQNIAAIYPIRDKRKNLNESVLVVMTDKLKIERRLDGFIAHQEGMPQPLGGGIYSIADKNGYTWIYDDNTGERGNCMPTEQYDALVSCGDMSYSAERQKIYDKRLNVIRDMSGQSVTVKVLESAFIISERQTDGSYVYTYFAGADNSFEIDCDGGAYSVNLVGKQAFTAVKTDESTSETRYALYDQTGKALRTAEFMSLKASENDIYAVTYSDGGNTAYAYYGADGTLILDTDDALAEVYGSSGAYVIKYTEQGAAKYMAYTAERG